MISFFAGLDPKATSSSVYWPRPIGDYFVIEKCGTPAMSGKSPVSLWLPPMITTMTNSGQGVKYPVMRYASNLESVLTYEGTAEMIRQLFLVRGLIGLDALS